jgi:hypothetical protein
VPGTRKYRYRPDIHARLTETAAKGRTINHSDLGTGRGHVGSFLYWIAHEEHAAGRPPLTAVVVHEVGGKPGPGFLEATKMVGYWRDSETEARVWRRALADVYEFWRPKLSDELS